MSEFPTLYNRRADGGLQFWRAEIDGSNYRTLHGQVDGEEVASDWTETISPQRALTEVERKYTVKREKGYSEDEETAGVLTYVKPMLAKLYNPDKIQFPVYVQPKYDGIRAIVSANGIVSRRGKPLTAPHILEALAPVLRQGVTLDGELYSSDGFEGTCSKARTHHADNATLSLQFHCFDAIMPGAYRNRLKFLQQHLPSVVVPTVLCTTHKAVDHVFDEYLNEGHEGAMVRIPGSLYEHKRSKNLLKVKPWFDGEYIVTAILEGEGNKSGLAGSIEATLPSGTTFRATVEGDREFCRSMLVNAANLVGHKATIKYRNLTIYGIPRHAVFTRWAEEV